MRSELKKDEKLLIVIRQHWINLLLPVLAWIIVTVLCLWLIPNTQVALIISFITIFYPLFLFLGWKHNLWAVTNMRVIDENGFISRYSKESPLDKINNVEYDQSLAGRIFGYGDVRIQTAAEMGDTTYNFIHHPKTLKDTITHAQEEYKRLATAAQAQQLAEALKANMSSMNNMSSTVQPGLNQQTMHSSSSSSPSLNVAAEIEKLFELYQKGAITQEEFVRQKAKLLG